VSEATHGGKGSRPRKVDRGKYEDNFDAIFGKKEKGLKFIYQEKLSTKKVNPEPKSSKKGDSI